jgi:hypothetical protein
MSSLVTSPSTETSIVVKRRRNNNDDTESDDDDDSVIVRRRHGRRATNRVLSSLVPFTKLDTAILTIADCLAAKYIFWLISKSI